LGFVLPFLAVGLFTGSLLDFFKKHQKAVRYTVKAGGVLMILMGVMMLTGWMNGFTSYLSGLGGAGTSASSAAPSSSVPSDSAAGQGGGASSGPDNASASSGSAASSEQPEIPAPDFTLTDQFGKTHTLSDYQGQVVFLNFWATWCGPCQREMPDIQAMYEDLGLNEEDVVVLAVANPKSDQYPYNQDVSEDEVKRFLEENGYTYPVAMDTTGEVFAAYGVRAFPTTFMIDREGNVFGYVESTLTRDIMDSIVQQTLDGRRAG
ncbi:MAG: redoxin domain-containing protein, partial [Ruthenibacterium lactatiformans]